MSLRTSYRKNYGPSVRNFDQDISLGSFEVIDMGNRKVAINEGAITMQEKTVTSDNFVGAVKPQNLLGASVDQSKLLTVEVNDFVCIVISGWKDDKITARIESLTQSEIQSKPGEVIKLAEIKGESEESSGIFLDIENVYVGNVTDLTQDCSRFRVGVTENAVTVSPGVISFINEEHDIITPIFPKINGTFINVKPAPSFPLSGFSSQHTYQVILQYPKFENCVTVVPGGESPPNQEDPKIIIVTAEEAEEINFNNYRAVLIAEIDFEDDDGSLVASDIRPYLCSDWVHFCSAERDGSQSGSSDSSDIPDDSSVIVDPSESSESSESSETTIIPEGDCCSTILIEDMEVAVVDECIRVGPYAGQSQTVTIIVTGKVTMLDEGEEQYCGSKCKLWKWRARIEGVPAIPEFHSGNLGAFPGTTNVNAEFNVLNAEPYACQYFEAYIEVANAGEANPSVGENWCEQGRICLDWRVGRMPRLCIDPPCDGTTIVPDGSSS